MRGRRQRYRDLSAEAKRKANVRATAGLYTRLGKIKKRPCRKCGDPNSQRHHPDYSKPLHVVWLCADCHQALHRRRPEIQRLKSA